MANKPLLVVGTKWKSSWSLRPWLCMKVAGVDFDEQVVMLDTPAFKPALKRFALAAGRVPVLVHDDVTLWESLAICEYAAETWSADLWPRDKKARAVARAVSNEMHAGFLALRRACSMDLKHDHKGGTLSPEAGADVHRVCQIWRNCRETFGQDGPYLFGARFTIADAMYAPVVTRFSTYGVPVDDNAQAYMKTIEALPAMQAWRAAALAEPDA